MYDAAGQVLNVQLTGKTPDQDIYTYDPNTGRMKTFEFEVGNTPKNLTGTPTWNTNGTLAEVQIVDGFNSGGSQTCYSNSSSALGYGYDDWGRLVEFDCGSGNWGQQFSYDTYDNLTTSVISGRTGTSWNPGYSTTNNHCNGCAYDANGDVTGDGSSVYGWNEFSKLAWTASSGTPTCGSSGRCAVYDAFGRIVEQSFNTTWRQRWITPLGFTAVMTGTSPIYAYWPAPGSGKVIIGANGSGYGYLHPDWLGNARITSDLSVNAIDVDQSYAPYGELYNIFGSSAGQYQEFASLPATFAPSASGGTPTMWDTPNRELSFVGRWLSPDPAGAGWNQYAYPTNPLAFTDPSGLVMTLPGGSSGFATVIPYFNGLDNGADSCTEDGLSVSCHAAFADMDGGAAVECPNDTCSGVNANGQPVYFFASEVGSGYFTYSGPGQLFYDLVAAGLAAANYLAGMADPDFASDPHEYADNIYTLAGVFSYTPAQQSPECPSEQNCTWSPDFSDIPDGSTLVGSAHTHPPGFGSGDFSDRPNPNGPGGSGDIQAYLSFTPQLFGFLVTPPGDRVLMFNPILYAGWPGNGSHPICVLQGLNQGVPSCP